MPSPPRSPMARSSPAIGCRRSAVLPMSARSRSRPRAGSTPNCCAAASWSAKSDAARSFPAKRGAGSRRRCEPRGARIDLEVNYPHAADAIGDDREKPGRAGTARSARARVAARVQHRHAGGAQHFGGVSRPRGLVTGCGPVRLHRQRQAMHRRRACGGGAARRPLRRRGADLSLHQGHRRPARRHAGAACDGRTRRASGRACKRPTAKRICRRCTFSRRFKIRWA